MINKDNYEIYLIDYMDGNLSADQVADLLLFLETHPDIAEEFEGLADVKLPASSGSFSDKKNLKKQELPLSSEEIDLLLARKLEGDLTPEESVLAEELLAAYPEVKSAWKVMRKTTLSAEEIEFADKGNLIVLTGESVEDDQQLLVAELEGDLTADEQLVLQSKLEQSESLQIERKIYAKTVLTADISQTFPGKRKLKKTPVVRFYASFSAAAAVAAAIALFFVLDFGGESVGNPMANHQVEIGNKEVPVAFTGDEDSSANSSANESQMAVEPDSSVPEIAPTPQEVSYQMAFAQLPKKAIPSMINAGQSVPVILASNREVMPYQLEEPVAEITNGGDFPTVKQLLGDKVKKGLWGGSDYPEDDYTMALLGKAADKYNDRSGSDVAIGSEKKEDDKFFVKIGKFSISR